MRLFVRYITLLLTLFFNGEVTAQSKDFQPQEVIFEHLGDQYGWKIGNWELPLPVIVRNHEGKWQVFSSRHLQPGTTYKGFEIAPAGKYQGKVVQRLENGGVYRPWDFSITRNVLSAFICGILLCLAVFSSVHGYKKRGFRAPRRWNGAMEAMIEMLYKEVIISVLGQESRRFAPYLLTLFFFILFGNLLGLIVVFPGGANLMGNIGVTLVLALCTFVVVNVSGTKRYWKSIFSPEVPLWLKLPIPMMPVIELFGVFTKPMALMIRLFANILGGHLITLVLISLIFLFGAMGAVVTGVTTVIAVSFAVFMELIDLLICFIQAYVFMMLSTIFIALAREKGNRLNNT